jgi:hypothetical protein
MPGKMAPEPGAEAAVTTAPQIKKIDTVVALLRRQEGASLDEMVQATGWLPHTTRAVLTGLKKKGHVVDKAKVDGVTRYMITGAEAQ